MQNKKRNLAKVLLIVVVVAALFALSACNSVSVAKGSEIDAAKFDGAFEAFSAELENCEAITIKFSTTQKGSYEYRRETTYGREEGEVKEVSNEKVKFETKTMYELVIQGNKAYEKSEEEFSYKYSDKKNSEVGKEFFERYYEFTGNTLYVIEKNNNKKWDVVSVEKFAADYDFSMMEYFLEDIIDNSGIEMIGAYSFDDLEYKSGFYKLKDSAMEEIRKESQNDNDDNNKYSYEYGKAHAKFSFSKDGLFLGCDILNNLKYTSDTTSVDDYSEFGGIVTTYKTTSTSDTKSTAKASVKYEGKVKIPSYSK